MTKEDVTERLSFARRRLGELLNLNGGNLQGADASGRQQLIQNSFFKVIHSTEALAQLLNGERNMDISFEDLNLRVIVNGLPATC